MINNNYFIINKTYYPLEISLNTTFYYYSTSNISLNKFLNIKNSIIYALEAVNWFSLDKYGFIILPFMTKELKEKLNVYMYFYTLDIYTYI